jgi:hypothetical protein
LLSFPFLPPFPLPYLSPGYVAAPALGWKKSLTEKIPEGKSVSLSQQEDGSIVMENYFVKATWR